MRGIYRKVKVLRNAALIGFSPAFTPLRNGRIYYYSTTFLRLRMPLDTIYSIVKKPFYIKPPFQSLLYIHLQYQWYYCRWLEECDAFCDRFAIFTDNRQRDAHMLKYLFLSAIHGQSWLRQKVSFNCPYIDIPSNPNTGGTKNLTRQKSSRPATSKLRPIGSSCPSPKSTKSVRAKAKAISSQKAHVQKTQQKLQAARGKRAKKTGRGIESSKYNRHRKSPSIHPLGFACHYY